MEIFITDNKILMCKRRILTIEFNHNWNSICHLESCLDDFPSISLTRMDNLTDEIIEICHFCKILFVNSFGLVKKTKQIIW